MKAAGFYPLRAAGSPAGNSHPIHVQSTGAANPIGAVLRGGQDVFTMGKLIADSVLAGVQAGKGVEDTKLIGEEITKLGLDNKLASAVLDAKRYIEQINATKAGISIIPYRSPKDNLTDLRTGPTITPEVMELMTSALKDDLRKQGFNASEAFSEAEIKALIHKWMQEEDKLAPGAAKGVSNWSKVFPSPNVLFGVK